jgi:hypothetical protein
VPRGRYQLRSSSEPARYLVGMNRIRFSLPQAVPWSRPYFVLPANDDMRAMYRSIGSGMPVRPPRMQLLHLTVRHWRLPASNENQSPGFRVGSVLRRDDRVLNPAQ